MIRRVLTLAAALAAVMLATTGATADTERVYTVWEPTRDGMVMPCVVHERDTTSSISCDWHAAIPADEV
ncbi:hypothetical protein [Nocardiopsis alba]|uniref:hypothetical protein n=1 Tax=Nocardiopsis alba TaxID=53437 RepID=UPI003D7375D1